MWANEPEMAEKWEEEEEKNEGGRMKITKRQLRRIIKEEKAKLMREASPEPGSGTQEEWHRVERENVINFLIEDGVNIEMDNPFLTNEQLHAILRITRGQTTLGLG